MNDTEATVMTGRGKSKRIRRNDTQWRALLSRFSTSGLSVPAFCDREAANRRAPRRGICAWIWVVA